jgi:hypothetical protein
MPSDRFDAALALEVVAGDASAPHALTQAEAATLAAHLAADLARVHPPAAELTLVTVGAHYDPVELLRPGWPLHVELAQLAARAPRAPGAAGQLIAFAAHDGRLPGVLPVDAALAGGPLRLVPLLLGGDGAALAPARERLEATLLEAGMASAATALFVQQAFGLRIEHARLLSLHDLVAMTALQYEHAGLGALWPIIEAGLLDPERETWLDAPPEPLACWREGEARIALFDTPAWRARHAGEERDEATLERRYARFEMRQRQFAAVLDAHALPWRFVHLPAGQPREAL